PTPEEPAPNLTAILLAVILFAGSFGIFTGEINAAAPFRLPFSSVSTDSLSKNTVGMPDTIVFQLAKSDTIQSPVIQNKATTASEETVGLITLPSGTDALSATSTTVLDAPNPTMIERQIRDTLVSRILGLVAENMEKQKLR